MGLALTFPRNLPTVYLRFVILFSMTGGILGSSTFLAVDAMVSSRTRERVDQAAEEKSTEVQLMSKHNTERLNDPASETHEMPLASAPSNFPAPIGPLDTLRV